VLARHGRLPSWLPPLSLGKVVAGAVAIKFAANDCNGTFVADNRVRVEVWEGATFRFGANYGDGSAAVRIDADSGQYIANFQPATGVHSFTVKVLFDWKSIERPPSGPQADRLLVDLDSPPELLILVADELDQLLVRKNALIDAHRPRSRVGFRVLDG
jgi:hypothetical protein